MEQPEPHKRYVIIHGHFYQPPRENPWTERIDRQQSAAPYHDWNEKIARECYTPNTLSRRLDGYGRITGLVNNYEWISFNFGPTLFSWLEEHHPDTYGRILDADRRSVDRFGGHGNAIAQCYNHMIMPLATMRDRETQIRWGVYDFEKRFGREPEGIWLPETAVNDELVGIIIGFGFRFIVLSPNQAARVRPLDLSGGWRDVSQGSIRTGFPYRSFGRRRRGGRRPRLFIDIFFYDGPLATDVSFNHLLRNGDRLADSIVSGYERSGSDLVVIATDGEVYGHHEPFADMALSYLIEDAAPARGLELTNFGSYLDTHEPAMEVQLKTGSNGEGTAWSCSHGVGRWKENCGCNVGAPPAWNQEWRAPLRGGLDALADALWEIFERETGELLKKPLTARDEYIAVIEARSAEAADSFLSNHAARALTAGERARALTLLESQRHAMLMFTSCGWFFNDISGIESVQLLEYAARAIECAGPAHSASLENVLLAELGKALSNIASQGTGADIYRRTVTAAAVDSAFLVSQCAITGYLFGREEACLLFGHAFNLLDERELAGTDCSIKTGTVDVTPLATFETLRYHYLLVVEGVHGFVCYSKPLVEGEFEEITNEVGTILDGGGSEEVLAHAASRFGAAGITLRDLFPEDRESVLDCLAAKRLAALEEPFTLLYEQNKDLLRLLRESSIPPPPSLLVPARTVLTDRLVHEVGRWERSLETSTLEGIKKAIDESAYYGVPIDTSSVAESFTELVVDKIAALAGSPGAALGKQLIGFVSLVDELGVKLDEDRIQNEVYNAAPSLGGGTDGAARAFMHLAERFNFDVESLKRRPGVS